MLGWHLHIYRQSNDKKQPASDKSSEGIKLASWDTNLEGIDWLENLVKGNKAISLGGAGYPSLYTLTVETLLSQIDKVAPKFQSEAIIDRSALDDCHQEEWLLVKAWDRS